jgi:membrane-associated protease RseP (regulator of RpoE activity)
VSEAALVETSPVRGTVRSDGIEVAVGWALAATASVVALAVLAPSGLWLLAFLGVVILVHELGHLVVARMVGMRPTEFFWGFGPEIVAYQRGDLRIGLKAVFLGGYVKIPGMTPTETLAPGVDEAGTYRAAAHWRRMATIVAGCGVNLMIALAAFGLAASLDGATLGQSVLQAFDDLWFVLSGTAQALWLWATDLTSYLGATVTGSEPPVRFMSPVSQAEVTAGALEAGASTALLWFGILSCAIGGVNLLPLPPLDGGHAAGIVIERVMQIVRRDRSLRFDLRRLNPLSYATVFVLVGLSLSALVMDLRSLGS